MSSALTILSDICGWIYFTAWSVSFYGQIYTNWKLKSVEGYKLDFQVLNLTGGIFYCYVNFVGFFYEDTNPDNNYGLRTVRIQDLVFAFHALIAILITEIQCFIYPRGKNKVSPVVWGLIGFYWVSAFIFYILFNVTKSIQMTTDFNLVMILGMYKLSTSIVKYIPPAYWNFKRRSTVGWSIENIILDFTGGIFSILQAVIDVFNGTSDIVNPIKFGLGNISILFDVLFIIQHYVLFPHSKKRRDSLVLQIATLESEQEYTAIAEAL